MPNKNINSVSATILTHNEKSHTIYYFPYYSCVSSRAVRVSVNNGFQLFLTSEITEFHGFQLFFKFGNVLILSLIKFRRKASIDFEAVLI